MSFVRRIYGERHMVTIMDKNEFSKDTSYTQNREISWLKFNERVLNEADDNTVPLFERFKFLAIYSNNLDEFFMVRVGSLYDLSLLKEVHIDNKTGETPSQQLKRIFKASVSLYKKKDKIFENLEHKLKKHDIARLNIRELETSDKKFVERYFKTEIAPVLSPQIIDSQHPFPHLENKTLIITVMIKSKDNILYGFIPIPKLVPKIIYLPGNGIRYVLVEDVIMEYCENYLNMYNIVEKTVICVTRNIDMATDDETYDVEKDFRHHIKKILKKRARLSPVRLEIRKDISSDLSEFLLSKLHLKKDRLFKTTSPIDLSYVYTLQDELSETSKKLLMYPPFSARFPSCIDSYEPMYKQIMKKDILLSFPYESIQPFLTLIKEASRDPDVISIKITLYRIDKKSKLAEYLIDAAENNKDVTVLMELRARFDEQNNVDWAERLIDAGCNVIYGLESFKVHSKICLITRKEENKLQYITQIGTGNYNEKTAKVYTDLSLMTANDDIGNDANIFFKNMISSNIDGQYFNLLVAPSELKNSIIALIDREIAKAEKGENGKIILKVNSLSDRDIIDKLSYASSKGVNIQMIVRGICCVVPQIPGKTENISVISIVGRFLEHSRIFCFGEYGEDMKLYISSADMMTRNTERRVEIACPIFDADIKNRIYNMLQILLSDNVKSRRLESNKNYTRVDDNDVPIDSQEYFMN